MTPDVAASVRARLLTVAKDFHDVWALAGAFAFDGTRLRDAVAECFARRLTPWAEEMPAVLTSTFYESTAMRARWRSYVSAGSVQVVGDGRWRGERLSRLRDARRKIGNIG